MTNHSYKLLKQYTIMAAITNLLLLIMVCCAFADETWTITAYCSCVKCCGKADGITASEKVAKKGYCALNWLPFGAIVEIEGLGRFKVMDRGARSLFGTKTNHIKHIDIWFPTHKEAKEFGVKWLKVKIIKR